MTNVFYLIGLGALCTSTFIFASMLAVLWHHRHALVGVFWTDQAGEPASLRRYYRITAALVVFLVITLYLASWLFAGSQTSKWSSVLFRNSSVSVCAWRYQEFGHYSERQ